MRKTVGEIAELVGGTVLGDSNTPIMGVNGIKDAQAGELTFLGSAKYVAFMNTTAASAVLVPRDFAPEDAKTVIQVDSPYIAFAQVLKQWETELTVHPEGIHPSAIIGEGVELPKAIVIGPYVCIGDGVRLGEGVILHAGVCIGRETEIGSGTVMFPHVIVRERVTIGKRCIIHAGAVIGSDGFGFAAVNGSHAKIPQIGTVIIGDDVEIGANTTVDRATCGATCIGSGTKIDNLVQIGHNVRVGDHCVISGQTGVAGSVTIGNHVTIAGQAGVIGHIEIGANAVIAGRSGVTKSIKPGQVVSGFPAVEHETEKRIRAAGRRVPDLLHRVKMLEQRLVEVEERLHGKTENHRK